MLLWKEGRGKLHYIAEIVFLKALQSIYLYLSLPSFLSETVEGFYSVVTIATHRAGQVPTRELVKTSVGKV